MFIGVTSDDKANTAREREVRPYMDRVNELHDAAMTCKNIHGTDFSITEIKDNYKLAVQKESADYIVLSPEKKTHERAAKINEGREELGYDRLQIIEAPMVTDYQDRKISSTRIVNGEINRHGQPVTREGE